MSNLAIKERKKRLLKFYSMLFGICDKGFVEFRPFKVDYTPDHKRRTWVNVWNKREIARTAWNLRKGHLFHGVATRTYEAKKKEKGNKKFAYELPALYMDLDASTYDGWDDLKEIVTDFPFEPSSIVFSGHGLHLYFFLMEPVDLKNENYERIENLLKVVQGEILHSDPVNDVSRILRAPFSHNIKDPTKPILVRILKLKNKRYFLSDFEDQYWKLLKGNNSNRAELPEENIEVPRDSQGRVNIKKLDVPAKTKKLIRYGNVSGRFKSRSEADMSVICSLLSNGYGEKTIKVIFQQFPDGIGEKYHEKGDSQDQYLKHSIRSAKDFLKNKEYEEAKNVSKHCN